MSEKPSGKSLGMPLEIARKNLREDPNTHEIAKSLGVEVEDYINKVLDYALNPGKEPEVELLDDESIAGLGPDAPSVSDVTAWLEGVAAGQEVLDDRVEVAGSDNFTTQADRTEVLRAKTGAASAPLRAPTVTVPKPETGDDGGAGSVLRAQLLEQQRNMQLGMDARRAGQVRKPPPKLRR